MSTIFGLLCTLEMLQFVAKMLTRNNQSNFDKEILVQGQIEQMVEFLKVWMLILRKRW